MLLTLLLSLAMMLGLFLMLLAGVGFIQNKKFFTSAPKEIQEVIEIKPERFKGQHFVGWLIMIAGVLIIVTAINYGGYDGVMNGYSYLEYLLRFSVMFLLLKLFDILFFDLFLLCHSNFYPHFFPECKDLVGPKLFGFNKKSHIIQTILLIVFAALLSLLFVLCRTTVK